MTGPHLQLLLISMKEHAHSIAAGGPFQRLLGDLSGCATCELSPSWQVRTAGSKGTAPGTTALLRAMSWRRERAPLTSPSCKRCCAAAHAHMRVIVPSMASMPIHSQDSSFASRLLKAQLDCTANQRVVRGFAHPVRLSAFSHVLGVRPASHDEEYLAHLKEAGQAGLVVEGFKPGVPHCSGTLGNHLLMGYGRMIQRSLQLLNGKEDHHDASMHTPSHIQANSVE